jgi:hypothetical protein
MTDAKPTPNDRQIRSSLSPHAQAVLAAAMQYEINPECYSREIAAAALRAAALQCKRDTLILLAIADELEGAE